MYTNGKYNYMKRSEMIKKIHEKMDGEPINFRNYAEQFLNVVEQLGMLPPSYIGLMANGKEYNRETDFSRDTMEIRGQWEPENE